MARSTQSNRLGPCIVLSLVEAHRALCNINNSLEEETKLFLSLAKGYHDPESGLSQMMGLGALRAMLRQMKDSRTLMARLYTFCRENNICTPMHSVPTEEQFCAPLRRAMNGEPLTITVKRS